MLRLKLIDERMLRTYCLIVVLFFFSVMDLFAQSNLFVPVEVQEAFEKGTRNVNGNPGPNYWQNGSDYKIDVTINPATRILSGEEEIIYHNNCPDSLDKIVIRLYQDIYTHHAIRDFEFAKEALTEGTEIEYLSLDEKEIDLKDKSIVERTGTNLIIYLQKKIFKQELKINVKWNLEIPNQSFLRMGAYSKNVLMVAYWYPQVAVLDDIDGWDLLYYTGTTEFYNDFSNYDVKITVPQGYSVWATGLLQNPDELFTSEYLERYNRAHSSDEIINIIKEDDLIKKNIYQNKEKLTWHYKAEYVPDFVFGMSDYYLWDAVSVTVDEENDRRVFVSAAYNKSSRDFYKVAHIARTTVEKLSKEFPAVPFPYPCLTVFNGNGGMEYPMFVNDGSTNEWSRTVHLTSHEISHTYFPFYMGTNERKHAWMDEGWAIMMPAEVQNYLAPSYAPDSNNTAFYNSFAGTNDDSPPIIPSHLLRGKAYRTASYYRPGAAYFILRDMLGKDKFDNALREYMNRWNGKHPSPYDFFYTFNNVTGEDLNWFWRAWFFDEGFPDLRIKEVIAEENKLKILIEKIGNIPVPIALKIILENDEIQFYQKADVWKNGNEQVWIEAKINGKVKSVSLGNYKIPDINKKNNIYRMSEGNL